jgi:HK97 family phage portal protein
MGLLARIANWFKRAGAGSIEAWFEEFGRANASVTGITVNQYTALASSAVMAATTMLAEDVAKLPWTLKRNVDGDAPREVKDHYLYELLQEPNDWMNGFELREMMQVGLILRGNAYAIIRRNGRGLPTALIPWNPDRMLQWVATGGALFYRPSASNMHEQALIASLGSQMVGSGLIAAEDVLHIRGFSVDGLAGMSRISLAREAVALGLAQEQQAARWMGQGAKPSGMLTTEQKLTPDAAKRLAQDFKEASAGLQNAGKIIVGEQGLKFEPFSMTSADLEFIASRSFQLQEIARIFRIPPHMLGELSRSTNNNIAQQAQEYINYTLTGYTNRWRDKMSQCFGLRKDNLSIEFDYRALTTADMTSRVNNWRTMIMSMMAKPDEARIDLGMKPEGGEAGKLHFPANMAAEGSQSTGTAPDDAGRPPQNGSQSASLINLMNRVAAHLDKFDDDQPRDDHGRFTSGGGGDAPAADVPANTPAADASSETAAAVASRIGKLKEVGTWLRSAPASEILSTIAKDDRTKEALSFCLQSLVSHGTVALSHATNGAIDPMQGLDASTWGLNEQLISHTVEHFADHVAYTALQAKEFLMSATNAIAKARAALLSKAEGEHDDPVIAFMEFLHSEFSKYDPDATADAATQASGDNQQ